MSEANKMTEEQKNMNIDELADQRLDAIAGGSKGAVIGESKSPTAGGNVDVESIDPVYSAALDTCKHKNYYLNCVSAGHQSPKVCMDKYCLERM